MYNSALLNNEVQEFIRNFEGDTSKLAFAGSPFETVSVQELIQQIEGRNKAKKKLPSWFETENVLFPPKLNLEQTSSEITAKHKASLVRGESIADITGGFGVDSFFFSEKFSIVHHFETNETLSEIAEHNFEVFGRKNVQCFSKNGLECILKKKYSAIYADPSRRHESKGKVFFLKDCEPNIPENISEILKNCDVFLLKTSPMLDISVGLGELKNVSEIQIVAMENDVKELLWLMKKEAAESIQMKTINFTKAKNEIFDFFWNETARPTYSKIKKYLYEPNAAILKSGAFDLVSEKFKIDKLHPNTHLYTSEDLVNFPGRTFLVVKVIPYSKSEMRAALTFKKANIATRNFPESVATLRKKWKIADGGDVYLFFVTDLEGKKQMLVCSKA